MNNEEFYAWMQDKTKQFRDSHNFSRIPSIFKKINTKRIALPKPASSSRILVEQAIENRRSRRSYTGEFSLPELSKLLYYANGFHELTDTENFGITYRSMAPSAGGRHSLELYVVIRNVDSIADGIYHYDVENHALEVIEEKTLPNLKIKKLLPYDYFASANVLLFMSAIHARTSWKYGARGYRLIYLDAGHLGQNVYLIGEAMRLAVCGIGGWDEEAMNKLLHIDGKKEFLVYAMAIGRREEAH